MKTLRLPDVQGGELAWDAGLPVMILSCNKVLERYRITYLYCDGMEVGASGHEDTPQPVCDTACEMRQWVYTWKHERYPDDMFCKDGMP